ncbi:MAG: cryptochrome/photolyase family protein [Candidatus Pacebacteria bacterium]|nr:cryptochrome/photolyase family protein [Candidatus Paceibacterota bacterium]
MEATLIYPHQLFPVSAHPALAPGRVVYLIEEPLLLTHNPMHRAKLILHRLTMKQYATTLSEAGFSVQYIEILEHPTTDSVFARLAQDGVATLHICDTTDDYLERAIATAATKHSFSRTGYDSPLFLLPKVEAMERYTKSRRFMANFYKKLRQDTGILMDDDEPAGGTWSFDSENRQKLPKGHDLPLDISIYPLTREYEAAVVWAKSLPAEQYGEAVWYLPVTHKGAEEFFRTFLHERLSTFGPYEDAIDTTHTRLYHSLLSPLMNIGLLTPRYVVDTTLAYAKTHDVPLASLEGFIRQIIGWREFIRASYEVDGRMMRSKNFFGHTRTLTSKWWEGTTGIAPLDAMITRALTYGYTHHIERLMVAGNLMLLSGLHPEEVYRWFMGMYIDAYDWVMVPNVYGMSQFADGGSFATKPYISGAAYIKKMSNYKKGDWEEIWTALYWHFIATHKHVFLNNHRLSMMPRLLEKMSPETRNHHLTSAKRWLNQLDASTSS